jgi:hypothetical protein
MNESSFQNHFLFCFVFVLKTARDYVARAGLELTILPLPPKCWDSKCVLCPALKKIIFEFSVGEVNFKYWRRDFIKFFY